MAKKETYSKLRKILLFIGLNLCFTAGILWIGYSNRTRIKKMLDHDNSFSKEDKVIMYDIFSSPLISDAGDLVHPPVKNSDELVKFLNNSTLPSLLNPLTIYDSCRVLSYSKYRTQVIKIRYVLFNDTLDAYSYINKTSTRGRNTTAVMHIPGSGDNRPSKVAARDLPQEDPTLQAIQINADIYFPVFPADDILAIHDGTKMLDFKKITSFLVSERRNLSLRYLADIFALEKWIRTQYSSIHVWGHSRGGSTATIASSVFLPDTLIVSSGYSVMSNKFFRLNTDQFWWSGANSFYDKSYLKQRFCSSKTKVFFLFGNKELDDIYGLEGKYFYTAKYFKECPNVQVAYSNNKHIWFSKEISQILMRK